MKLNPIATGLLSMSLLGSCGEGPSEQKTEAPISSNPLSTTATVKQSVSNSTFKTCVIPAISVSDTSVTENTQKLASGFKDALSKCDTRVQEYIKKSYQWI